MKQGYLYFGVFFVAVYGKLSVICYVNFNKSNLLAHFTLGICMSRYLEYLAQIGHVKLYVIKVYRHVL